MIFWGYGLEGITFLTRVYRDVILYILGAWHAGKLNLIFLKKNMDGY